MSPETIKVPSVTDVKVFCDIKNFVEATNPNMIQLLEMLERVDPQTPEEQKKWQRECIEGLYWVLGERRHILDNHGAHVQESVEVLKDGMECLVQRVCRGYERFLGTEKIRAIRKHYGMEDDWREIDGEEITVPDMMEGDWYGDNETTVPDKDEREKADSDAESLNDSISEGEWSDMQRTEATTDYDRIKKCVGYIKECAGHIIQERERLHAVHLRNRTEPVNHFLQEMDEGKAAPIPNRSVELIIDSMITWLLNGRKKIGESILEDLEESILEDLEESMMETSWVEFDRYMQGQRGQVVQELLECREMRRKMKRTVEDFRCFLSMPDEDMIPSTPPLSLSLPKHLHQPTSSALPSRFQLAGRYSPFPTKPPSHKRPAMSSTPEPSPTTMTMFFPPPKPSLAELLASKLTKIYGPIRDLHDAIMPVQNFHRETMRCYTILNEKEINLPFVREALINGLKDAKAEYFQEILQSCHGK
ncbi:hypothetical protein CC80DRAFT_595329 [Byssothecium circinans]|uniref:Uncharacterized protein n=1 Tax=Byssothecium circinans TaxID=147558 RepID=A0A6A5TPQ0_9PLEO|nr:hypothetical protein CC80DRAFT_595329 [Byssothecium circinans]